MSVGTAVLEPPTEERIDITNRCVILRLNLNKMGGAKALAKDKLNINADPSMIHGSKQLFGPDCREWTRIKSIDSELRDEYLKHKATGCSVLGPGFYMISLGIWQEVKQRLLITRQLRDQAVDEFISVYERVVVEAAGKLRVAFDAADYPPPDEARRKFTMTWRWLQFEAASQLRGISEAAWEEAQAEIQADMDAAREEFRTGLRVMLSDIVAELLRLLGAGKTIRKNSKTLDHFQDFLRLFEHQNITNDRELAALVAQLQRINSGVPIEAIRKDRAVQEQLAGQMVQVQVQLAALVQDRPDRIISFEDDEE